MDGHRLAGDGGGVDAAVAGDDHAVQGDAVAGTDYHPVAGLGVGGGDGLDGHAGHQMDHFGPQIHGLHDLAPGPGHGLFFEKFTDAVEEHDAHGFGEFIDAEGAQGGDGHEEILVQHAALDEVFHRMGQDLTAQHQIGAGEGCLGDDAVVQQFQHQTEDEQQTAHQNIPAVAAVLMMMLVVIVAAVAAVVVMAA